MKITITGSLGNISKPLAEELIQKGHSLTIISSNPEKQKTIEAMGAKAAIGTMENVDFLTSAFKSADVVYAMETLGHNAFFDKNIDIVTAITNIGKNYKQAIEQSGVKRVIHLSSIGAHTDKGNGLLAFHYNVEHILNELPDDVSIKFMRPVGFYYNMFAFIPTIKAQNAIISNYGGDDKEPWVSPLDIAAVIAEEMEKPFDGAKDSQGNRTIRYIASEELSPNEVAKILGEAIGKPDLKWLTITDEEFENGLLSIGMSKYAASGVAQMNASRRGGVLYQDYERNKPILGKTKLTDFTKEFVNMYSK